MIVNPMLPHLLIKTVMLKGRVFLKTDMTKDYGDLYNKSMQIQVKYFAIIREKIKKSEETFSFLNPTTTTDLWKKINEQYDLHDHADYIRFAVNMTYVEAHHPLNDGDVVALITPVAGG